MKNKVFACGLALVSFPLCALAQNPPAAQATSAADAVQNEIALVTRARTAARSGDETTVDEQLAASTTLPEAPAPGILLARRGSAQ